MEVNRKSFGVVGMRGWFIAALVAVGQAADGSEPGPPTVVPISPDGVQRATVILDSYSYSPNHLVVENGKPVELTLTSVTLITPHNFIIKESAGSLSVEQDVRAGRTVVARFVPTQPGLFPFFCDKRLWPMPSHRDKGMEGILEVK
ncbi:MAG: quinol oxidase [Nitrospira sp. LK265]|nr:quinol oxidase [Nitrospira sp. LK265]